VGRIFAEAPSVESVTADSEQQWQILQPESFITYFPKKQMAREVGNRDFLKTNKTNKQKQKNLFFS